MYCSSWLAGVARGLMNKITNGASSSGFITTERGSKQSACLLEPSDLLEEQPALKMGTEMGETGHVAA